MNELFQAIDQGQYDGLIAIALLLVITVVYCYFAKVKIDILLRR